MKKLTVLIILAVIQIIDDEQAVSAWVVFSFRDKCSDQTECLRAHTSLCTKSSSPKSKARARDALDRISVL